MRKQIILTAFLSCLLSIGMLYLFLGPGTTVTDEITVAFRSVPSSDGARQTFYIVGLADADGKRLVPAVRLAKESSRLDCGKLVNEGHGIWSDLPAHGNTFVLEWRGFLPLERGAFLFAEMGKSVAGSLLDVTIGRTTRRINLAEHGDTSPLRVPLGTVTDITWTTWVVYWLVASCCLTVIILLLFHGVKIAAPICRRFVGSGNGSHQPHLPRWKRVVPASVLGVIIFFFLPFLVYALNWRSVDFPAHVLLQGGLLPTVVFIIVAGSLSLLPRFGAAITNFYRWATLMIILLAVFPNRTGEMAGFADHAIRSHAMVPTGKAIIFGIVCWSLAHWRPADFRWFYRLVATGAVLVTFSLIIFSVNRTGGVRNDSKQIDQKPYYTELGIETNVIVIVLDAFTGKFAERLFQESPRLRESFNGFTLYPNAIASALNTPAGLAAMLTGSLASVIEEDDITTRNKRIFADSFLYDAHKQNIPVGCISPVLAYNNEFPTFNEQKFHDSPQSCLYDHIFTFINFLSSSTPRIFPHYITNYLIRKHWFSVDPSNDDVWHLSKTLPTVAQRAPLASYLGFQYLIKNLHVGPYQGKVLVFHSKLTHAPWSFTEFGNYTSIPSAVGTGANGLKTVALLVDRLQELAVLDKTLLLVVSDHGHLTDDDDFFLRSFNPLMLVRHPNANGAFSEDSMTVWLGDVAATVRDFLGFSFPPNDSFSSRSLLRPSDSNRVISVPLFVRPDQAGFHSPLKQWKRIDCTGKYEEFRAAVTIDPDALLKSDAQVILHTGIDHAKSEWVRQGWLMGSGMQIHVEISIAGISVAKIDKPGVIVIRQRNGKYHVESAFTPDAQRILLGTTCVTEDAIIAGVQVDSALLKERVFAAVAPSELPQEPVNYVFATGPSVRGAPVFQVGTNDIQATLDWAPNGSGVNVTTR